VERSEREREPSAEILGAPHEGSLSKVSSREIMEAPGRVELPTNSLGNCCSIHLSYGAIAM
jgi:hypothetical protein